MSLQLPKNVVESIDKFMNMSFKIWQEARELKDLPIEKINLKEIPTDQSIRYEASFSVKQEEFTVNLVVGNDEWVLPRNNYDDDTRFDLQNILFISFRGHQGYDYTNTSGFKAKEVYDCVLASILKVIEKEKEKGRQINGFSYDAYDDNMDLVYERFHKSYLLPHGYIRLRLGLSVRKDYLDELNSSLSNQTKEYQKEKLNKTELTIEKRLARIKNEKNEKRKSFALLNSFIGKFVNFTDAQCPSRWMMKDFVTNVGIILNYSTETSMTILVAADLYGRNRLVSKNMTIKDFDFLNHPDENEIDKFIQIANLSPNFQVNFKGNLVMVKDLPVIKQFSPNLV